MKDLLAQKLLAKVLGTNSEELVPVRKKLQALSYVKYDDYGGFTPGVKFIESLAEWLSGFDVPDRMAALNFVLARLVYVSAAEMDHLVSTVYRDMLRPRFRQAAAEVLGLEGWQVARITASKEFAAIQRRTLVLGMSDGARLDRLRRSSEFSTEQFHLDYVLQDEKARKMRTKLERAMDSQDLPGERKFRMVLVVDDISASGMTMLRCEEGAWDGKVVKVLEQLDRLKALEVVSPDATVVALLYLTTAKAKADLADRIARAGFADRIRVEAAHTFEPALPLDPSKDAAFWELCERYFRPHWVDEHTEVGGSLEHGFGGVALPLVLHHNAPNNAPPILWKDEPDTPDDYERAWVGVFPRHERHHPGRP